MDTTLTADLSMAEMQREQDRRYTETVARERARLSRFIRRRVPDVDEAEDILQDVLFDFLQAYRLPEPIEQIGAWLFRVARNRIIDGFRKKRELPLAELAAHGDDDGGEDGHWLEEALPPADAGPDAAYARRVMLDEIHAALGELPPEQRAVFVAHELEGVSFKEMVAASGLSQNTLLARKRYAVLYLRKRLQRLRDELEQA